MRTRHRRDDEREELGAPGAEPPAGGAAALRTEGRGFLAAGDEAIRRALSRNSEEFLAASRQRGGQ